MSSAGNLEVVIVKVHGGGIAEWTLSKTALRRQRQQCNSVEPKKSYRNNRRASKKKQEKRTGIGTKGSQYERVLARPKHLNSTVGIHEENESRILWRTQLGGLSRGINAQLCPNLSPDLMTNTEWAKRATEALRRHCAHKYIRVVSMYKQCVLRSKSTLSCIGV